MKLKFEVFMTVSMQRAVFGDVTTSSVQDGGSRFLSDLATNPPHYTTPYPGRQ
jgi:hypothetical protein